MDKTLLLLKLFIEKKKNKLGLTQEELAEKAGISRAALWNIENKDVNVSLKTLQQLLTALDSNWGEFAQFLEKPSDLSEQLKKLNVSNHDVELIKAL